jgi:hypothetical protein
VPDKRIDVLSLRWYVRRGEAIPGAAVRWIAAGHEHLPEAVPTRYGEAEPLRRRWHTDGGEAGFVAAHADAIGSLILGRGDPPVLGGGLATMRHVIAWGPVVSHSLDLDRTVLDDPAARLRVLAFFTAVADGPGGVYAEAHDVPDVAWTGRTLYHDRPPERPYLAAHGDWIGLPPTRPRWAWFGPPYVRRVRRHLPAATPTATGLLDLAGDPAEPGDAVVWVPERLRARPGEVDPARRGAAKRPRGLHRSPLFGLTDRP